jgi:hypothetical protein
MTRPRTRPYLMEVMTGAWRAQAVYVAARLGIADMLAKGPRPVHELAREAGAEAGSLYRVLRALASLGIFRLGDDGMVELTGHAEPLRADHPDSVRQFAVMVNEEIYQAFGGLLGNVQTGQTAFQTRFGIPIFEYYDAHPGVAAIFHQAMNDWSNWDTHALVESYDFSRYRTVVDVGGGNGAFLSALLARYAGLSGVLYDRPAAIEAARAGLGGPLPRCELVVGDFQEDVPAGADLYVIKHVIDGWPDEGAAEILGNIRRAMPAGGRVLVLDCVIDEGNKPSFIKWLDLMVMVTTAGGRMRRVPEYPGLFARAGLSLTQVLRISDSVTLLEGASQDSPAPAG